MSARSTDDLITDLLDLCRETQDLVDGVTRAAFLKDAMRRRAVERTLELIGEVATRLGDDAPAIDVPWDEIRRLRILLAHAYHKVEPGILYVTATRDVPGLLHALEATG